MFNDVLAEEQASRDYGPLLGKMGVINAQGDSAMDEDQWEAASGYLFLVLVRQLDLPADVGHRSVYGVCFQKGVIRREAQKRTTLSKAVTLVVSCGTVRKPMHVGATRPSVIHLLP